MSGETEQRTKVLRVATRCASIDQFVEAFARYCQRRVLFIASMTTRSPGSQSPFVILLADGSQAMRGTCEVVEAWTTPTGPYRRPGVRVKFLQLDAASEAVLVKLHAFAPPPPPTPRPPVLPPLPPMKSGGVTNTTRIPSIAPMPGGAAPAPAPTVPHTTLKPLRPTMAVAAVPPPAPPSLPPLAKSPSSSPSSSSAAPSSLSPLAPLKPLAPLPAPPVIALKPARPPSSPPIATIPPLLDEPAPPAAPSPLDDEPKTDVDGSIDALEAIRAAAAAKAAAPDSPFESIGDATGDDPRTASDTDPPPMEERAPGSPFILPANPLANITDDNLRGFVECTLYEETGKFSFEDLLERTGEDSDESPIVEPPLPPELKPIPRRDQTPVPRRDQTPVPAAAKPAAPETAAGTGTETAAEAETGTETGTETAAETGTETETETETETGARRRSRPAPAAAISSAAPAATAPAPPVAASAAATAPAPTSESAEPTGEAEPYFEPFVAPPSSQPPPWPQSAPPAWPRAATPPPPASAAWPPAPPGLPAQPPPSGPPPSPPQATTREPSQPFPQLATAPPQAVAPAFHLPVDVDPPEPPPVARRAPMIIGIAAAALVSGLAVYLIMRGSNKHPPVVAAATTTDAGHKTAHDRVLPDPDRNPSPIEASTVDAAPTAPPDPPLPPDPALTVDAGPGAVADPPDHDPTESVTPTLVGDGDCSVELRSSPPGAEVRADGKQLGETPLTAVLPCGRHRIKLTRSRYQDVERTLSLDAGTTETVTIALERPQHKLKLASTPGGATVTIDGKKVGNTPTTVTVPGFTTLEIEMRRAGFRTLRTRHYSKKSGGVFAARLEKS